MGLIDWLRIRKLRKESRELTLSELEQLIKKEELELSGDLFIYPGIDSIQVSKVDVYKGKNKTYHIQKINDDTYQIKRIIKIK